MGQGQPRKAQVLRILTGAARANPERDRDDAAVRAKGKPAPLLMFNLSDKEAELFAWLMANGCLPAVHGLTDSLQIAEYCKLVVQRDIARAKVEEGGHVVENPSTGRLSLNPYLQAWMALDDKINRLGGELALTPAGRLRHAPPATGASREPTSWDAIPD